jgi:hypothetical protein
MSELLFIIGEAGQNPNIQFYDELSRDHYLIFGSGNQLIILLLLTAVC